MGSLALTGGSPAIAEPLGKSWPVFGEEEHALLQGVLESGIWWRGGYADQDDSQVGRFERDFSAFQDAKKSCASMALPWLTAPWRSKRPCGRWV